MKNLPSIICSIFAFVLFVRPMAFAGKCEDMANAAKSYFQKEKVQMQIISSAEEKIARDNERLRNHSIDERAYKNNIKKWNSDIDEARRNIKNYHNEIQSLQNRINKECR